MNKLKDSVFNSIVTDEVKKLRDVFKKHGYEIRIAGGAVRDVIMDKQPKDLDFATTASVLQMKEILTMEDIRMVNPRIEKYGIVTACITKRAFEIATINVRIPAQPTEEDWIRYAIRRDFTMNSMFLDFDGNVHDHLGGRDDLKEGKVRFIGSAERAIEKRHLRILRYFRFHSKFAKDPYQHEVGVLEAIEKEAGGLQRISGQRIWKELKLILQEKKSRNVIIQIMMNVGIGPYIGILRPNLAEFQNVARENKDTDIQPASLLAALLNDIADAKRLQFKLKYSEDERNLIYFIIKNRENTSDDSVLPYLKVIFSERKWSEVVIMEYITELILYHGAEELLDELPKIQPFRILIKNLTIEGISKWDPIYNFVIEKLIEYWYENHYNVSKKELLKLIPDILQEYRENE